MAAILAQMDYFYFGAVGQFYIGANTFVPVQLGAAQSSPVQDIRIELKRGATTVVVHWPSSACAASAAWLREILR